MKEYYNKMEVLLIKYETEEGLDSTMTSFINIVNQNI